MGILGGQKFKSPGNVMDCPERKLERRKVEGGRREGGGEVGGRTKETVRELEGS